MAAKKKSKKAVKSKSPKKSKKTAKKRKYTRSKKNESSPSIFPALGFILLIFLSLCMLKLFLHKSNNEPTTQEEPDKKITQPIEKEVSKKQKKSIQKPTQPKPKKNLIFSNKPKLVFVIDDMGNENRYDSFLHPLGDDITYAILPHLSYSKHFSRLSQTTGAEVILHLPLEALSGQYPGPGLLTSQMSEADILQKLQRNLSSVPHHVGANNHMGSLGSSDPRLIRIILSEIKRQGLFFLDSYTSAKSVILPMSRQVGVPTLKRDVFLDNIDKEEPIREQIFEASQVARQKGWAIAIGHYRKNTLKVLMEEIPKLKNAGFEIVALEDLKNQIFQD